MYACNDTRSFTFFLPVPMSAWKKEALEATREELGNVPMKELGMLKKLKKSDVCNPAYPSLGFLIKVQLQVVASLPTDVDRMNKVIDYLLEMEDKYFEFFCKLLEQYNNKLQANLLRKRAEELKSAFGEYVYSTLLRTCACVH